MRSQSSRVRTRIKTCWFFAMLAPSRCAMFVHGTLFAFFLIPFFVANAATFSLTPSSVEVRVGGEVSVAVSVDAGEERIVTAKLALSFSSELFEFVSFTLAPGWIPLSARGYDEISAGRVVKTAGFPTGFAGTKEFGVFVFRSRVAGKGDIEVLTGDSLILTAGGVNTLSGGVRVPVVVFTPAPVTPPPVGAAEVLIEPIEANDDFSAVATQTAAIAESGMARLGWRGLVFALLALVGVGAGVWYTQRK